MAGLEGSFVESAAYSHDRLYSVKDVLTRSQLAKDSLDETTSSRSLRGPPLYISGA